jgi:hypothetical protein
VALAVERTWETCQGEVRSNRYHARRFSPKHVQKIQQALLALFDQCVVIVRRRTNGEPADHRMVHVLDSFGYSYIEGGRPLDLDELPPGREKVNVGTAERPVYRVRRRAAGYATRFDRPTGVTVRLNAELARELAGASATIRYTLMAGKVFSLFRQFMHTPSTIRLIVLVLRQVDDRMIRDLPRLLDDLGFAEGHPSRAVERLTSALHQLQSLELIRAFSADLVGGRLEVDINREWHRSSGAP